MLVNGSIFETRDLRNIEKEYHLSEKTKNQNLTSEPRPVSVMHSHITRLVIT